MKSMAYRVDEEDFRAIAAGVLDRLPGAFRKRIENVVMVVEDYPSAEEAARLGVRRTNLLGLFHGISRFKQEWGGGLPGHLPERIVLYQRNIEAICSTEEELVRQIRLTVLHEIGHYFGLSEEDIRNCE